VLSHLHHDFPEIVLLGFRHFFRHAYTFEIDWNKLQPLITHIAVVLKQVGADISAFFEAQLNPGARGKEC